MPIIEVSGLRKVYGGRAVVDGVSFAVQEGEIFGVLGPNGAGKTTTVECLEGLRVPDGGTVRVGGLDPVADHDRVTQILGSQLQESELQAKLTVREALELYSACYARPADWRQLAERLGLDDRLSARFGKLSGGQKQRLFIALALIGSPRVVVLDELTTGLDPRARRDTWRLIEEVRDSGVTVLLITHFMACLSTGFFRSAEGARASGSRDAWKLSDLERRWVDRSAKDPFGKGSLRQLIRSATDLLRPASARPCGPSRPSCGRPRARGCRAG
nr:ABC transporter ATP-binding protein [Streptomyces inhibens]